MKILITGVSGFIGCALCKKLSIDNEILGVDLIKKKIHESANITYEQVDLLDWTSVNKICEKYSPEVIIHCAGIAHQKIGSADYDTYMRVNSTATVNLAKAASIINPDVIFLLLSSISVYGEGQQLNPLITQIAQIPQTIQIKNNIISENSICQPSSDYAFSKLDAEKRLLVLVDKGILKKLIILRLAPVYDREWSFNLDRRVFAPKKVAYLKFGNGQQKMSALARPSLVEFIQFLLQRPQKKIEIMNVCDAEPYEFNEIIQVFKNSNLHPNRPVITIPLFVVWLATRIAGLLLTNKRKWIHSCYEKLASSLVYDNEKMLKTGFQPRHSLHTVFAHNK